MYDEYHFTSFGATAEASDKFEENFATNYYIFGIIILCGILTYPLVVTPLLPIPMIFAYGSWIMNLMILLDLINGSAVDEILMWMPDPESDDEGGDDDDKKDDD